MPTFVNSTFVVDLQTLCAVTGFVTITGGLLLLLSWMQDRSVPALAFWGSGYLIGSFGAALVTLRGLIPDILSVQASMALICGAYGLMWAGARTFEGRRIRLLVLLAGPMLWLGACQIPGFYQSAQTRVVLASAILVTYVLLGAREVWYARNRELISRWPILAVLVLHAGFLLARMPIADTLNSMTHGSEWQRLAVFAMAFEALFTPFCLAFLRVSMAKERAELEQRKAALTDSLTGIANRRAFFETGAALLARTIADRRPAALLLFDLDRFKEVNDTAGHQGGDRVLRIFCDLVTVAMRPGDLFARLGGEEFACLLPDMAMTQALQLAERARREFAGMPFPGLAGNATVSVGVAMASEAGRDLPALLAIADRALYRAKAEGRNRVAPAPLVLIDNSDGEARQPADAARSIALGGPVPA